MDKETELDLQPASLLDPALVLFLPLYKKDGAIISSDDGYGHSCVVTGATLGIQGRTFDGTDDKVTIPDRTALQIIGDLTLELWAYRREDEVNAGLISKSSTKEYSLVTGSTSDLIFRHGDGTAEGIGLSTGYLILDTWRHIALTRVLATKKLSGYANGTLIDSAISFTKTPITGTDSVLLGLYTSAYTNIIIGEVRIYNRALSASEILHNYEVTKWRFN